MAVNRENNMALDPSNPIIEVYSSDMKYVSQILHRLIKRPLYINKRI
jgi:hypothetical protein